jgi:hypothetical protein
MKAQIISFIIELIGFVFVLLVCAFGIGAAVINNWRVRRWH